MRGAGKAHNDRFIMIGYLLNFKVINYMWPPTPTPHPHTHTHHHHHHHPLTNATLCIDHTSSCVSFCSGIKTLKVRKNGRHCADGTFNSILIYGNCCILIQICQNKWYLSIHLTINHVRWPTWLMHICVTPARWVNIHIIVPLLYIVKQNFA